MVGLDWIAILREAGHEVLRSIGESRGEGAGLPLDGLKALLDKGAQEAIIESFRGHDLDAYVVSEEGDCILGEGAGTYIVLDPVDGTTNLAKGLRPAVTSLAVSETPRLSGVFAGLVMNLYTGDYYYAEREGGAYYGIKPIRPAGIVGPEKALLSLDMSKIPRLEKLRRILESFPHLRWMGCSAMSLCNVASGILDAHLDLRGILRITDVAAGLLILKEAGGFYSVNERVFGDVPLEKGATLELTAASNRNLLQEINGLIR